MKSLNTKMYSTPIHLKLPVDLERIIKINDPVYSFGEVIAHIDLQNDFVEKKEHETSRPRYDREKLLKIVLFVFMEFGYCSARFIQNRGAFGEIKWNRGHKRLHRRGIDGVTLELGLISCGFNRHKYHLRKLATQAAA